jgi:hypothetical protein
VVTTLRRRLNIIVNRKAGTQSIVLRLKRCGSLHLKVKKVNSRKARAVEVSVWKMRRMQFKAVERRRR